MKTSYRIAVWVLALLVVGVTAVSAQQHQHPMSVGAVTGDRVPDTVAYRLYFTHVSQLPENLQIDQVKQVGLTSPDSAILTKSLVEFGEKYLALATAYNAEATVAEANGRLPNVAAYHTAVAKLVDGTVNKLFATMSTTGVGTFVSRVKSEKSNMHISESEAGQ
jgi:hypothetical protein